jgi:hypothetical protein
MTANTYRVCIYKNNILMLKWLPMSFRSTPVNIFKPPYTTMARPAKRRDLVVSLTILMFVGCATTTNEQQGEVIGAVLGSVLGAQVGDGHGRTAAIIVGTIADSLVWACP